MIKLVALDMDGTLLNSKSEISLENEQELKRIAQKGIKIVLASGRPSLSLKKFYDQLSINNENNYSIAFNGSQVVNNLTGEIIYSKTIKGDAMKKAYLLSKKLNTNFYAYRLDETILYNDYSDYMMFEKNLTGNPCEQVNLLSYNDEDKFIKMTFTDSKEKIDQITSEVTELFSSDHTVVRSHAYFLEIINPTTSKGDALIYLCNYLNIDPSEVMSFGDNENDFTLLNNSGYRIAMSNSQSKHLKSIATEIAPSNDDNGVAYILKKYIK